MESMQLLNSVINKTIEDIEKGLYIEDEIQERFRYILIIMKALIVIFGLMIRKIENVDQSIHNFNNYIKHIDEYFYNMITTIFDALDIYLINSNYGIKEVHKSLIEAKNIIKKIENELGWA